jgi:hypothetical protein
METHWNVEFTGVELAGGAKLAAPMEKAMAGHSGGGAVERKVGESQPGQSVLTDTSVRFHRFPKILVPRN